MERLPLTAEGSADWTMPFWAWLGGVTALLLWHAWLTLALFGDSPWHNLTSDQPIVSGVHGQHLYLGSLGARSLVKNGRTLVYDHANLVGYPKTPIYDGARLAELWLLLGGGSHQPAAYKIGFAGLCMLVPLFLLGACWSLEMGPATSLLATLLGLLIWWGPHGRTALLTGDCELYLAALATLTHVGFLVAYHRTASITAWFGLWITSCIGWFMQPLFFPIALPVLLIYYLSVGAKHDFLTWHVAFWSAESLGFLVNLPWLTDWLDSWWLRTPLPIAADMLEHRTFATIWNAPIWGGPTSRLLAVLLTVGGSVGVVILHLTRQRPTARMLGLASTNTMVLALLGISWEPLGALGTSGLLAPALWFACIPTAHAIIYISTHVWKFGLIGRFSLLAILIASSCGFVLCTETPFTLLERCVPGTPFEIGLGPEREAIVQTLVQYTNNDARILWEDRNASRHASRWPALLPLLTERTYIGGLDPDGIIEHSSACLTSRVLEGRPIATWTDDELKDYCRRYNVRWIVAWSPEVIFRFSEWRMAEKRHRMVDGDTGWLFEVKRTANFALKGKADFLEADGQSITLGNVIPHQGEVIISLHYQEGMRASPGRVQVERAMSGDDPIGFVRLRLAVPAARVTLTWER